jgi:hypothetical protein
MGEDYVRYVAVELLRRFQQQDAGTEMLAIKCEERPRLLTSADERTGTVRRITVELKLQVLLQTSSGQCRRLRGDGKFSAVGLDKPGEASASIAFDIHSTEEAV